jgi:hypothetical protein
MKEQKVNNKNTEARIYLNIGVQQRPRVSTESLHNYVATGKIKINRKMK